MRMSSRNRTGSGNTAYVDLKKSEPFEYVVKTSDNTLMDFKNGPWYVYAEVARDDGIYFYTQVVDTTQNDGGNYARLQGQVDKLWHWDVAYDDNNPDNVTPGNEKSTIYATGENIGIYLIRGKIMTAPIRTRNTI